MLYTLTVHVSPYLFNLKSVKNVYDETCMVAYTIASTWNLWKRVRQHILLLQPEICENEYGKTCMVTTEKK